MTANGVITGTDTNWQSPLSLIRVGATIVFLTNPIKMATISAVVSPTELRAIDTDGTEIENAQYIILLHDSITVDGLAQDVAETLRYYQSSETELSSVIEYLKAIDFDDLKIQLQAAIDASEVAKQSAIEAKASENASAASSQEATEQAAASKASQDAAKVSADSAAESAANAAAQLSGSIKYRGNPGASIDDVNQMLPQTDIIGVWDFGSSDAYSLPNVPEAVPGSLEVAPDGSFGGMQIYTTEKGNQYVRALTSDTEWSAWAMVGYMGNTITVASNLDILVAPGRYSTASNTPVDSQIGIIEVSSMNSGEIVQTFKAISSSESESNKIYQRSATGSPLVWTAWIQFVTANLNGISQALRGVGSSLTLGTDGSAPMDATTLRQVEQSAESVVKKIRAITEKPEMIAHRGFAGIYPENTMIAYRMAANSGADALEGDVSVTADGARVICHDDTVDRTSNGTGTITALNLTYLRGLDFGTKFNVAFAGERIPLLSDVLAFCKLNGLRYYPELKNLRTIADTDLVVSDILAAGMEDNVVVQCFDIAYLQRVRTKHKTMAVGYLFSALPTASDLDALAAIGNAYLLLNFSVATSAVVSQCNTRGIKIAVWTINKSGDLASMRALGINKVMGNYPLKGD
ncbi:putative tail protein [Erwinia phage Snitter]|nr:putative tail protein [Erwinia phage Snitter]